MKEYFELGSSPCDEECAQVGSSNYKSRAKLECRVWADQLRRTFPEAEHKGLEFRTKSFPHDFGSYYEVVAVFNRNDLEQVKVIYDIDDHLPQKWDETALKNLS